MANFLHIAATIARWTFRSLCVVAVGFASMVAYTCYELRYSHDAGDFNETDRAVLKAIETSPTGTPDAMRQSVAKYVDEPVLTKCKWSLYRYRGDRTIPKIAGRRPDKFTVTCNTTIEHCVTSSPLLRPISGGAYPSCWVEFHWYYTDSLGVYRSEWDRGNS